MVLAGCSKRHSVDESLAGESTSFEFVIGSMVGDDESSRATINDGSDLSNIKNMWLVQFASDGTYVSASYYADFDATSDIYIDADVTQLLFLANTFNADLIDTTTGITLADARNFTTVITEHNSVLSSDGTDDADQYCTMSGIVEDYDRTASTVVTLHRNCAKINVRIVNNIEGVYSLYSLTTLSIPEVSYLVPYYEEGANFPIGATYLDSYKWSDEEFAAATTDEGNTFYFPINRCGTGEAEDSASKSSSSFVQAGATAIRIALVSVITDETDETEVLRRYYTFYLGENMITDYNITDNYYYQFLFTISSMGNTYLDPRISVSGNLSIEGYTIVEDSDTITAQDDLNIEDYDENTNTDEI